MLTMTVFTPTYNRAHTLPRLFDSLLGQTVQDFEWLIVDDGSTDDTEVVVKEFVEQAPFPVRYLRQENAGKHAASNRAVREAEGLLFWTVDSDDWLLPHAVETMLGHWRDVEERGDFAAVTGLCETPQGDIVGAGLPADVIDSNSLELRYRYKVTGDKAGFTRTDVMRQHPFPEGEFRFVPESIVWTSIGQRYLTRYINEPVLVKDYQSDGFTLGGTERSPEGRALYYRHLLTIGLRWLRYSPQHLVGAGVRYVQFALIAGDSPRALLVALPNRSGRAVALLGFPLGAALAWRARRRTPGMGQ